MKTISRVLFLLIFAGSLNAKTFTTDNPAQIYIALWRGCEEACQGFKQALLEQNLPIQFIIRDVARDKQKLPILLREIKALKPDLVVTWGTSVSKHIIGQIQTNNKHSNLGDIPSLFMIVADPLGAGIVESYEHSGRPQVTGVRNRVPEEVQIRTIQDYLGPGRKRIAVIYSTSELNSVLNTQKLEVLSNTLNFELLKRQYQLDTKGKPLPNQLPGIMRELSERNVDIIYVGSSSYNQQNRQEFTEQAGKYGLPVASGYGKMVTQAEGLLAVANRYYNVGKLAANQARKVLFAQQNPGDLDIPSLSRYSVFINMRVARKLKLYPPIQLLRLAELINP